MTKKPGGRARPKQRKTIPISSMITDLLAAAGPDGLTNDELSVLLFGVADAEHVGRVRYSLWLLRRNGVVESWHPPVRHRLTYGSG